jgi:hypothetical protein
VPGLETRIRSIGIVARQWLLATVFASTFLRPRSAVGRSKRTACAGGGCHPRPRPCLGPILANRVSAASIAPCAAAGSLRPSARHRRYRATFVRRRIKASKSAGAIRIELRMRTCASSPLSHNLYTVALQTCRSFATCFTISRLSGSVRGVDCVVEDLWLSSKLAAKFWLNRAKRCDTWIVCDSQL